MSVAPATALVTGGASGIGAACVRALREQQVVEAHPHPHPYQYPLWWTHTVLSPLRVCVQDSP